jgi:hypothetical protein
MLQCRDILSPTLYAIGFYPRCHTVFEQQERTFQLFDLNITQFLPER